MLVCLVLALQTAHRFHPLVVHQPEIFTYISDAGQVIFTVCNVVSVSNSFSEKTLQS